MEIKDLLPYIIAILSGIGSWIGSYLMATKKSTQELKALEKSNTHEIDKLMKQHEVDITSIKEKHKLDMEIKDKDHQHQLELLEKQSQNTLIQNMMPSMQNFLTEELKNSGAMEKFRQGIKNGLNNS